MTNKLEAQSVSASGKRQGEDVRPAELPVPVQDSQPHYQRPTSDYQKPSNIHRVPRSSMIRLNGERVAANQVQRFDGQPLYYVLDKDAHETGEVTIFTQARDAQQYAAVSFVDASPTENTADVGVPLSGAPSLASVTLNGYVELFQHINYSGSAWTFYPSWGAIPDFSKVYPTLWWHTNIEDRVSSMDVNVHADPPGTVAWVILYADRNFGGSQLWTSSHYSYDDRGGGMRKDLGSIGWNDLASSLRYGYSI